MIIFHNDRTLPIILKTKDMELIQEVFGMFPRAFIQAFFSNFTLVAVVYFVVWKLLKKRLQNWRIQIKERVDAAQIKSELINAVFTLAVGAIFASIIFYLSTKGYTKIYTNYSDHSPFFAFGGFFIFLLVDDAWFYWCHRLLHHPKVFRYVHAVHHESIDVNPFTSLSFHWFEPFLLTFWIFPVSIFIPMYAPAIAAVQLWGLLENVKSHVGYEFYPAWWHKSILRFMTSSTHHNMHHNKFKGNYGIHFRIWDRLFGTEFKNYEEEYNNIQERKKMIK